MAPQAVDDLQGLVAALGGASGSLQEAGAARAGHRLLEEIQSVVIVEHLDGVRQGNLLVGSGLGAHIPLLLLGIAARLQLLVELLVREQSSLGVREVFLHLHDADAQLADLPGLGLDGGREGRHLLVLRSHHLLKGLDALGLLGGGVVQRLLHGVTDLLDDACDLATRGHVARGLLRRAGEEGEDLLAVHVDHVRLFGDEAAEQLGRVRLQEATGHALFEGSDGLVEGGDVGVQLGFRCRK
mmetsp:Transcript_98772/g.265331  ORF Transcript_98772/g.265331 Transcript_98772/m.265331 type:complete len:241 (+) Transcript_98772:1115-1837(+)